MERDASITLLLVSWSEGNPAALEELTPHVYRELRALAKSYLRWARPNQTLQPTALVNEAWLRLWIAGNYLDGRTGRISSALLQGLCGASLWITPLRTMPLSGAARP